MDLGLSEDFGPDWFSYPNFYSFAVREAPEVGVFVEVGCHLGRSTHFLASEIKRSGKQIELHCVDSWSDFLQTEVEQDGEGVYRQFLRNMAGFPDLRVHRGLSWEVSVEFEDESLDFVFIDADHVYESVLKDLRAWYPKVKRGGILSGHDFNWVGVERAVKEFFPDESLGVGELCWAKVK